MQTTDHKPQFEQVLNHLREELNAIHTGRATPSAIENITVDCYGSKMPMIQLASISAPEPKQLVVQPWDTNNIQPIEKALRKANLGFGIAVQEKIIRLNIPMLTEERRLEIVKNLKKSAEKAKLTIRQIREKTREQISGEEKNKQISEDEKYKFQEEIDKLTKIYTDKIEEIEKKKEEEIMTV